MESILGIWSFGSRVSPTIISLINLRLHKGRVEKPILWTATETYLCGDDRIVEYGLLRPPEFSGRRVEFVKLYGFPVGTPPLFRLEEGGGKLQPTLDVQVCELLQQLPPHVRGVLGV